MLLIGRGVVLCLFLSFHHRICIIYARNHLADHYQPTHLDLDHLENSWVMRTSSSHRQQTARQVDRQTDTQTYGDLINWGEITLQVCCPGILVYLFLWLLSCKFFVGGWLGESFGTVVHLGRSTMPGWYKVCQIGRSEQQVHLQHLLHLEFRVHFWLVYSCVQFAVPADWEAPGKWDPSHRWA